MDGTKFAKMLSDKHLFELDRLAYKYSVADVKEFSELLRQNFVQPLPLVDFTGQAIVCLPNLAQISTSGMKQLLSVPAESQPFGVQAMTEEIHATLQIENIHSTRNSIRHILNGNAPRNEEENRIYGMKRWILLPTSKMKSPRKICTGCIKSVPESICRQRTNCCRIIFTAMMLSILCAARKAERGSLTSCCHRS